MSSNEFEVVSERPKKDLRSRHGGRVVIDAVSATATTGGSVRIAINGDDIRTMRARFQNNLRLRSIGSVCTRVADDYLYVWVEPKA